MLSQLVSVILIVISLFLITTYKQGTIYVFGLLLIGFVLCYILMTRIEVVEHLQISGEAAQNVGSIFNSEQMTVKNLTATGNLTANGDIRAGSNVIHGGLQDKNRWIIHTPNDDRRGIWIASGKGTDNWDWGKSVMIDSNGHVNVSGNVINFGSGWSLNASDGHLRFFYNGDQKYVLHNNDALWTKQQGYLKDALDSKVGYGQNISIHGRNGRLDNYAARCDKGDRDRDVGMSCGDGIGGENNTIWRVIKR